MDGWGHDGKGVVFTGSDNLVPDKDGNPNPQMRTAKRGDKVGVSIKGTPGHYYPGTTDVPLFWYELRAELTKGLVPDESSIQIKVDGTVLDSSLYSLSVEDSSDSTAEGIGYVITAKLEWAEYTKPTPYPEKWEFVRHLYEEDAEVELSFSATVGQSVPPTTQITATSIREHTVAEKSSSAKSPATVLIDGNLVIQRTDEAGEPLAGASYSVAGLKATKDTLNDNVFHYDSNGDITSFTTDEAGKVVILGVPLGQYTVIETATPEGHTIKQETQQVEVNWLSSSLEQYDSVVFEDMGSGLAKYVTRLADGSYVLSPAAYGVGQSQLPYDSASGSYRGEVELPYAGTVDIAKKGSGLTWTRINKDNYSVSGDFIFDEQLGKNVATWGFIPVLGTPSADVAITKEGDTLKIDDNSYRDFSLVLDSADGCYRYETSEDGAPMEIVACEENNGYTTMMSADYSELLGPGAIFVMPDRFNYDESTGLYSKYHTPSAWMVVDEITPETLTITGYPLLNYSPSFDIYYTSTISTKTNGIALSSAFRKTIQPTEAYGTNVLFSEMADNVDPADVPEDVPEDTPNPQTSDTLTKAACIILAATTSAYIIGRKLSRR